MLNLKLLFIYLTLNLLLSNLLFAATPPKYRQGGLTAFLTGEYYSTQENFDNLGGQFAALGTTSEFSYYQITPRALYGLSNSWGIDGSFDFISGKSSRIGTEKSAQQITDISTNIYYKILKNKFYILPRLNLQIPLVSFDITQEDVILNEGAMAIEAGSWIERKWLKHKFYIYAGYRFVSDGRAHLIPFKIGVYRNIYKFNYGLSIDGNEIAQDDEYILTPEKRSNRTAQLNAGSKRFYSVNPKLINFSAWAGYRLGQNFILSGKYTQAINGTNTAKGQSFILALKWRVIKPFKVNASQEEKEFKIDGLGPESSNSSKNE